MGMMLGAFVCVGLLQKPVADDWYYPNMMYEHDIALARKLIRLMRSDWEEHQLQYIDDLQLDVRESPSGQIRMFLRPFAEVTAVESRLRGVRISDPLDTKSVATEGQKNEILNLIKSFSRPGWKQRAPKWDVYRNATVVEFEAKGFLADDGSISFGSGGEIENVTLPLLRESFELPKKQLSKLEAQAIGAAFAMDQLECGFVRLREDPERRWKYRHWRNPNLAKIEDPIPKSIERSVPWLRKGGVSRVVEPTLFLTGRTGLYGTRFDADVDVETGFLMWKGSGKLLGPEKPPVRTSLGSGSKLIKVDAYGFVTSYQLNQREAKVKRIRCTVKVTPEGFELVEMKRP